VGTNEISQRFSGHDAAEVDTCLQPKERSVARGASAAAQLTSALPGRPCGKETKQQLFQLLLRQQSNGIE